MYKILLVITIFIAMGLPAKAQHSPPRRRQVYSYGYNYNGNSGIYRPGLSIYPRSGWYSQDYPAGRRWYRYGYQPIRRRYYSYENETWNPHEVFLYGY